MCGLATDSSDIDLVVMVDSVDESVPVIKEKKFMRALAAKLQRCKYNGYLGPIECMSHKGIVLVGV